MMATRQSQRIVFVWPARVQQFLERFPNVPTIHELGSLEGGHTFTLARREGVERVLAIEGRPANVEVASGRA